MRLFYFLLKFFLQYALRIYYPNQKRINPPKSMLGRTIYVSNHPASFMDPLVIGVLQRPSVFFMTRSDVFTRFSKPFLWLCQMLPIYRQHDGEDTKKKNQETFSRSTNVLKYGRNLLIFGEGFTDDTFIRRLKPVKKGAVRMGFSSLEALNWKKKIYLAAIGINYSEPNKMRSDLLISNSERICLNDYRKDYEENANKTINELTKKLELMMRAQITHVENKNWTDFHESVMRIMRNGMHPSDYKSNLSLENRWKNSKALADWMNQQDLDSNPELVKLKEELDAYFKLQKKMRIEERIIARLLRKNSSSRVQELIYLICMWPVAIIGLFHCFIPYIFVKRFVEKSFKRAVFWSSVKMILACFAIGLLNIPIVWVMNHFLFQYYLPEYSALVYYFLIPIFGLAAYVYNQKRKDYLELGRMRKIDKRELFALRHSLKVAIREFIPLYKKKIVKF